MRARLRYRVIGEILAVEQTGFILAVVSEACRKSRRHAYNTLFVDVVRTLSLRLIENEPRLPIGYGERMLSSRRLQAERLLRLRVGLKTKSLDRSSRFQFNVRLAKGLGVLRLLGFRAALGTRIEYLFSTHHVSGLCGKELELYHFRPVFLALPKLYVA